MNRQLSTFDIHVIVTEFEELIGNIIDKIFQISRDEIIIRVKNLDTKQKEIIYIKNGKFICLSKKLFKTPERPSTFAMTLRKYLQNGRIKSVTQHEFDRIIKIKIEKKDGDFTLIIEFFSNGNIILNDPNGNIILPLIRQSWSHRSVKGREPYIPPPSQINPFKLDFEKFSNRIRESNSDIVRTLAVNINLSGPIAEEICTRSGIEKTVKIKDLDEIILKKIYDEHIKFLLKIKNREYNPVLVKKQDEIIDILPFEFISYKNVDFEKTTNMIRGLDEFVNFKDIEQIKKENKTDDYLEKLKRQLRQQEETIKKFQNEIKRKKIEGDLIYLHYQEIDQLIKKISEILELKEKEDGIKKINEIDFVKKFNPQENLLILNLSNTSGEIYDVKINFRKSVSENATKAYDGNKKLKGKLKGAEKSILKTKEMIEIALKKQQIDKKKIEKPVRNVKTFWFEKYRWFISSEGNIVVGGRDSKTNEIVVKKYLNEGDRYAHADIQGAPSIIIKAKNIIDQKIDISDQTLKESCIFAASYSKAWKQYSEAQAYWVFPEQVSKTAQSGEFVPKGAFIIRGKRNYQRCALEIAVGEILIDEERKIMAGPVDSFNKRSNRYVVLVPGGIKKSEIAKKISIALNVSIDDINSVLPSGGSSIVEMIGVKL